VGLFSTYGKAVGASTRASRRAAMNASNAWAFRSSQRGARRGILGPGDPAPVPGGPVDYYDYRGVASPKEVANLAGLPFSIGTHIDPRRFGTARHRNTRLGLADELLERHAVVLGPSGSGKTEGVLVPWIDAALRSGHSVVTLDVKGDLVERIHRFTARSGQIGVPVDRWDFTRAAASKSWGWVAEARSRAELDAVVVAILGREPTSASTDPYFYRRDTEVLRGLVLLAQAASAAPTPSDLKALLDQVLLERTLSGRPSIPGYQELWPHVIQDPADFDKATSGVRVALGQLTDPSVAHVSRPGLNVDSVLSRSGLFNIVVPLANGQTAEKLASVALAIISQRLYSRLTSPPGGPRVFLVLDEAARLLDRVDLANLVSVVRSAGVSVVMCFQTVEQIKDENDRGTILGNCGQVVSLRGASERTADYLKSRLGDRPEVAISNTIGSHGSSMSRGVSTEYVPVLRPREISDLPFGERTGLVFIDDPRATNKPIVVDLTRPDLAP